MSEALGTAAAADAVPAQPATFVFATAALAGELDGVLYESRGRRELRNVRAP